jgi:uncharacterized protein (DUF169 family)
MENHELATALIEGLRLERPPIGVAFVEDRPSNLPDSSAPSPSACTFWRRAETELFYAPAAAHYECPIGAMTMGFELPAEEAPKAQQLVGTMIELGYFGAEEVSHLPAVKQPHQGIVYGPLEQLPLEPDAVLVQVSPFQAMLLAEADEGAALRETPRLAAMGRPACAVLARSVNEAVATLSLGCIGARTYVELPDDRAILVLPASSIARTIDRLPGMVKANETLAGYHGSKKARFEQPA